MKAKRNVALMGRARKRNLLLALWLAAALVWAAPSRAVTISVDVNGNGLFTEIQPAIDAAQTGDTVLVKPGEYVITEPITFQGKAITVTGELGAQETTIRMLTAPMGWHRDSAAVVLFASGEGPGSLLEGLTLTGSPGSGVSCVGSSPSIENCAMTANYERGVQCLSASPTITHCVISGSWGDSGVNCREHSSPDIANCTIWGNSAVGSGGGGVYCNESSPTLTNCIISGNVATSSGGGGVQCVRNASPTLINCTISTNSAGAGGGVDCWGNSAPTLTNCIVWDNAGGALSVAGESSVHVTFSCVAGDDLWPGVGNINADPRFAYEGIFDFSRSVPVEINGSIRQLPDYIVEAPDYHLLPDSPCINAGTLHGAPPTDFAGNARPFEARVDMGAFELVSHCPVAQVCLPLRGESGEMILGLGTLRAAAYSPDGMYVATAGSLGAFVWNAETGALYRVLGGHTSFVISLTFSPEGTRILTGSQDGTAKLWDVVTGQKIHTFSGGEAVAFSAGGSHVLTGSRDGAARLWDANTGQEIRAFIGHTSSVTSVAFSPDGRSVLTGSEDGTARIWQLEAAVF